MTKPKDRTEIWATIWKEDGSYYHTVHNSVLYERYEKFEYLPSAVQSDDTKREYEEFWRWKRMNLEKKYSIYYVNKNGDREFIVSAPSMEEAEQAWDLVCKALPQYKNKKIEWQTTFFDDEIAVGDVV